ncbi:MAG: protein kinase domain-containing protein [Planctomycetota bacterium]
MSTETRLPDTADEEFLDRVFERAVASLEDGLDPVVEDLLEGRVDLRSQAQALLQTARQVAVLRPRTMPAIPGFTLLHEIGRGGMGTVYLARQQTLGGRRVALKVLPSSAGFSSRARERFLREASAIANLRHPNVVTVHDVVTGDGVLAYSMEWVEGASLADLIDFLTREKATGAERPGARTEPELARIAEFLGRPALGSADSYPVFIARIGVAIARALAALHRTGLVHRDVKPSNILVRRDGTPLLSDFGLVHATDASMTQSGQFAGTIAYASPEQLEGDPESLDARSDVFGLGITLYHALTLHLPFDGQRRGASRQRTPSGMLHLIEGASAAPLRAWNRRLPRDLETIVGKATDPDPARRYAGADDLADDLERVIALQPIRAKAAGVASRAAKFLRRNRVAAFGITLGSVVSIAAAMAIFAYLFLVPRWSEEHVRRARLWLLDPAQAGIIIRRTFWGVKPFDFESPIGLANLAGMEEALREYSLASRWRPLPDELREERDTVAAFRASLDRPAGASSPVRAALSPRCAGLYAYLEGDVDSAVSIFSRWDAERDPRAAPDPFVEAALGVMYLFREEAPRAYPRLRDACQAFPDVGFLTTYLADAALQCGDVEDAERLLSAAAGMRGLDSKGAMERVTANLHAVRGRDAQAEAIYKTADPETPCGLQYARFLASRGRTEEALDQHVRGWQRVPSKPGNREFAALLDRWWAGFPAAERLERIRATLEEDPSAPRSLVARLRAYVPPAAGSNSPLTPAPPTRDSSPSLQDASLAELRDVLEVENEARWREIPK